MIAPAALVLLSPILVGSIFGVEAVVGLLVGAMSSSVQLAISMFNTGGAWDDSKKFCEKGGLGNSTACSCFVTASCSPECLRRTSSLLSKLSTVIVALSLRPVPPPVLLG